MRCSKCGSDNREGAKFCNACGTAFSNTCAACGALNQPGAKFCDECGTTLTGGVPTTAEGRAAVVVPSAGERRHLTVLFCDMVGSSEIAARLDPEEWRETVAAYHRAAAEAITVTAAMLRNTLAMVSWPCSAGLKRTKMMPSAPLVLGWPSSKE